MSAGAEVVGVHRRPKGARAETAAWATVSGVVCR